MRLMVFKIQEEESLQARAFETHKRCESLKQGFKEQIDRGSKDKSKV